MGKPRRDRRAEREEKRAREAALESATRARKRRQALLLVVLPIVFGAGAGALWFGLEERRWAAGVLLAGTFAWLGLALGMLGGGVPPRDRLRANDIRYGRSRRGP